MSEAAVSFDKVRIGLVSISDRASTGVYEDKGIPALKDWLTRALRNPVEWETRLIPDEQATISATLIELVDSAKCDLVLTTGGTGIAPRDVTYDTLKGLFDSEIPGFGELFRMLSYQQIGAAALLSRAIGGVLAGKVVLAMPGSPKALALAMDEIVLREAAHLVQQTRARP